MKKKLLFLLIIGCLAICITGCFNNKEDDNESIAKQNEEKMLSCFVNVLEGYIVTEKSELVDIPLNTFTNKSSMITYYNASLTDDENIYVIFKSDYYQVIRDFDLYFSSKFDTYQTYNTIDNIYIYIHNNNLNDIDFNDLNKCSNRSNDLIAKNEIDSKTMEKLNKTNKIVIKAGDNELGTIIDTEVINELLEVISSSKQYGDAFFCDGHVFDFEMYNDKGKLIDIIYVWGDGRRLIPESIAGGCSYYSVSKDIREIIERETNYIFYSLDSLSDSCEDLELIYEDELYNYYFDSKEMGKILIKFDLTGLKMKIKYAIDNNYITINQLSQYSDLIIKKEK